MFASDIQQDLTDFPAVLGRRASLCLEAKWPVNERLQIVFVRVLTSQDQSE